MGVLTGFVFAFIVGVVVLSFYVLIRPDKKKETGWEPFPKIHPKDIPDANQPINHNCVTGLVPCLGAGDCKDCGGDNMECTIVTAEMHVFYPPGSRVPPGRWCLPKLSLIHI